MNKIPIIIIVSCILVGFSITSIVSKGMGISETEKDVSSSDWGVALEENESEEPDQYKSYMIIIENKSRATGNVEVTIEQPISPNSKFFSEPTNLELKPGETVELGEYYIYNHRPQKFNVILVWEDNAVKREETFILEGE